MGFLGLFLKISLECFDILAWPLIAFVYPLCASIQAIETDSNSDIQKLITYWVCFSLILLFEHAFLKLLLWLPFWTYIKLVIVGYLVIPEFDGSLYVYKYIVLPCLTKDRFFKLNEFFSKDEHIFEGNKDAKKSGANSLENVIASKLYQPRRRRRRRRRRRKERESERENLLQPEFQEPNVVQKDYNVVEMKEKKEFASNNQLEFKEHEVVQKDYNAIEIREKKELASNNQPEFQEPNVVQKDYNVVEIKEKKEFASNNQLEFREHEVQKDYNAIEIREKKELASNNQKNDAAAERPAAGHLVAAPAPSGGAPVAAVAMASGRERAARRRRRRKEREKICCKYKLEFQEPNIVQKGYNVVEIKEKKEFASNNQLEFKEHEGVQKDYNAIEIREKKELASNNQVGQIKLELSEKITCESLDIKEIIAVLETSRDIPKVEPSMNIQKEWACALCQVTSSCEANLISHINGREHADAYTKLKAKNQSQAFLVSSGTDKSPEIEEMSGTEIAVSDLNPWTCALCKVTATSKTDLVSHFQGKLHGCALENLENKYQTKTSLVNGQNPWTCGLCSVTISSEKTLISHLKGKRHQKACERHKAEI